LGVDGDDGEAEEGGEEREEVEVASHVFFGLFCVLFCFVVL
jgi:hypothetical protein